MTKVTVNRETLPEALHVALRKICDSNPTSILWNLIYKLEKRTWPLYLDHVWAAIEKGDPKSKPWEVLRAASKSWEREMVMSGKREKLDHHGATIMDILFGMFTAEDWKAYASFLDYDPEATR